MIMIIITMVDMLMTIRVLTITMTMNLTTTSLMRMGKPSERPRLKARKVNIDFMKLIYKMFIIRLVSFSGSGSIPRGSLELALLVIVATSRMNKHLVTAY